MGVLAPIFLSSSSSYTRMKPEFMISTRFSYRHMVGLKKKYNTMNDIFLAGTESDNKGLCSVQVSVQASNEMFWTNRAIIWFTWFPFCTYFHFINVEFKYSETKNNLHRSEMLHIFTKKACTSTKFHLALMGVLTPWSAHARPSARPPIGTTGNFTAPGRIFRLNLH